jgi:hypothetical protein
VHHRSIFRHSDSGFTARKVLVISAASLVPLGLLSVTLYAQSNDSGSSAQKSEVEINTSSNVSEVNDTANEAAEASSASGNTSGDSSVSVTVNGENIPVPPSGNLNQTIPTEDGSVNVQVQDSTSSGDTGNHSSVNVNVDSDSSEDSDTDTRTRIRIRQR